MTAPALRTRLAFRHGRPVALLFAEHGGFAREPNEVRFWARVEKGPGCWLWRGQLDRDGYGRFSVTLPPGSPHKQRFVLASRYAWELAHGWPFPPGRPALRTCGERRCVRPDHLLVGTFADCGRKGVKATGERNGANTHPEKRLRGRAWHLAHEPETRGERPSLERRMRLLRLLDDRTPTEIVELRPDLWQYERAVRRDRARARRASG